RDRGSPRWARKTAPSRIAAGATRPGWTCLNPCSQRRRQYEEGWSWPGTGVRVHRTDVGPLAGGGDPVVLAALSALMRVRGRSRDRVGPRVDQNGARGIRFAGHRRDHEQRALLRLLGAITDNPLVEERRLLVEPKIGIACPALRIIPAIIIRRAPPRI